MGTFVSESSSLLYELHACSEPCSFFIFDVDFMRNDSRRRFCLLLHGTFAREEWPPSLARPQTLAAESPPPTYRIATRRRRRRRRYDCTLIKGQQRRRRTENSLAGISESLRGRMQRKTPADHKNTDAYSDALCSPMGNAQLPLPPLHSPVVCLFTPFSQKCRQLRCIS